MDYTIYWGYAALIVIASFGAVTPWAMLYRGYVAWRAIKAQEAANVNHASA